MCARVAFFDITTFLSDAIAMLGHIGAPTSFQASYNVAPTQPILTLLPSRQWTNTHFGFKADWMKHKSSAPVNARSETVFEKPMFREAIKINRALIVINGYYEWQKQGNIKQPYYVQPTQTHNNQADSNTPYFALGAITQSYFDEQRQQHYLSSAILTTAPNPTLQPLHHRMPLILPPTCWRDWLDSTLQDPHAIAPLLAPANNELMHYHLVSRRVNSPTNNDAGLTLPVPKETLF